MKTSFTKWRPDPDGAAAAYSKAGKLDLISVYLFECCCLLSILAVAFKNGKALAQAKSAYEKAANCQLQSNQLFHAAKLVNILNASSVHLSPCTALCARCQMVAYKLL